MSHDVAIKLNSVSKYYLAANAAPSIIGNLTQNKSHKFFALKNINLTIYKGEKVGLFGPNGAGKTTLIKLISGITTPSEGTIETKGKIVTISDLEAGFHPDLTGKENIYMSGLIIGMTKKEIESKFQQIINFAEIEASIHKPFYTYSSGMKFRIAFAVAIASKCDVLIIDEVFVVGDINFQKKTAMYIKNLQKKYEITTLISSHVPLMLWTFSKKFYQISDMSVKNVSKRYVKSMIETESRAWEKIHVDYRLL